MAAGHLWVAAADSRLARERVGAVLSRFEKRDGIRAFQRHANQANVEFGRAALPEDDSGNFAGNAVDGLEIGAVLPNLLQRHAHQSDINVGRIVAKDDVGHVEHERLELLVGLFVHIWILFAGAT